MFGWLIKDRSAETARKLREDYLHLLIVGQGMEAMAAIATAAAMEAFVEGRVKIPHLHVEMPESPAPHLPLKGAADVLVEERRDVDKPAIRYPETVPIYPGPVTDAVFRGPASMATLTDEEVDALRSDDHGDDRDSQAAASPETDDPAPAETPEPPAVSTQVEGFPASPPKPTEWKVRGYVWTEAEDAFLVAAREAGWAYTRIVEAMPWRTVKGCELRARKMGRSEPTQVKAEPPAPPTCEEIPGIDDVVERMWTGGHPADVIARAIKARFGVERTAEEIERHATSTMGMEARGLEARGAEPDEPEPEEAEASDATESEEEPDLSTALDPALQPNPPAEYEEVGSINSVVGWLRMRDLAIVAVSKGRWQIEAREPIGRDELIAYANRLRGLNKLPPFKLGYGEAA